MRRITLIACAVLALYVAMDQAEARPGCNTRECRARVAHRQCDNQHPRTCVLHVIYHERIRGWVRSWLLTVPACESTWNPLAVSPYGHKGLYQFADGTWASTPYGHRSIFSARWQPYAAAWMIRAGRIGEWGDCG